MYNSHFYWCYVSRLEHELINDTFPISLSPQYNTFSSYFQKYCVFLKYRNAEGPP